MFGCFFFLIFALLLCLCVNVLHVFYLFTNFNDYNSSTGSTFFHIYANIDKDANYLQSNNNTSSKNLWLLFSNSLLFLKVWFSKSGNITFRFFLFLFAYLLLFLHKAHQNSRYQEAIRSCSRYKIFTFDFIYTCQDNSKAITVGIIYRPTSQGNFWEVLNDNMNNINSVNNEIYIMNFTFLVVLTSTYI